MRFLIGLIVVIVSTLSGFIIVGGHLHVLWQPAEFIIIIGSALGSFIIANPPGVLYHIKGALSMAKRGDSSTKEEFLSLLLLLFSIFKIARSKGLLSMESQLDQPLESPIFEPFPLILAKKNLVFFMCDYLRMITMGCDSAMQIESLMDQELDTMEHDDNKLSGALQTLADATPALGIVAAVLGVIHTMGSIDQPPAVLGKLIGGALVGTFLGVLIAYGFIGPLASSLKIAQESEMHFYKVVKASFLAFLNGMPPIISVEFARKNIDPHLRPLFSELEAATQGI